MELRIDPGYCDFPVTEGIDEEWFEEVPDEGYATISRRVGKYKVVLKR